MPEYLEWSLKLSRPGTVIIADNVVRDGKVLDAEQRRSGYPGRAPHDGDDGG